MSDKQLNSPNQDQPPKAEKPEASDLQKFETAYRRILHQLTDKIEEAEKKTWSAIKHDIDQAVELEAAAEEMTREELSLLAAYLKRDLEHFTHFVAETRHGLAEWLQFDIELLEDKIVGLLLSIADKTTVAQNDLRRWSERETVTYKAGEYVMGGTFVCVSCGDNYVFTHPVHLEICVECGAGEFRRVTVEDGTG